MAVKLFLIDATGPFFVLRPPGSETNWSKAPFELLERDGGPDDALIDRIATAFTVFASRAARLGYNAVTIDDLAHVVCHDFYPEPLRAVLARFDALYRRLFAIAESLHLKVFVTSDIMFYNAAIAGRTRGKRAALFDLLEQSAHALFEEYPSVAGVVLRFGESDGIDVSGAFHSALTIRTVAHLRQALGKIVSLCERHNRMCILRTWTLGAYPIGDLMWNTKTYAAVFEGFDSPNLAVSHKFGETDFFRYLNLNPLFHAAPLQSIIELQTRREYEGFGSFPVFIGFDYERYARYLANCPGLIGISVWCQTGGWSHFDDLTFIRNSSPWTELNTAAAIAIFRYRQTAEESAARFARSAYPAAPADLFIDLLRLCDRVLRELWYLPEFSGKRLYFRRTRVPPLIWILWDNILINHTLRKILRRFVHARREAVLEGYRALEKIKIMERLARRLGMDPGPFVFMYDTFELLANGREYYLGEWDPAIAGRIEQLAARYASVYPEGFHVLCDFQPVHIKKRLLKIIFTLCLRTHPRYRLVDLLILNRFAALVYPLVNWWQKRRLPSFAREQAMGIGVLFK